MDHPVRQIPGFYYDCEKKKYFAIQAHAPASTAYSAQDVKRRKTRDERRASKALQELSRKGRIQSSKVLAEPLAGDFLEREYGGVGRGIRASNIIARNLTSQGKIYSLQYDFRSTNSVLFSVEYHEAKSNIRLVYDNLLLSHEIDWNNEHVDCRRTTNGAWFAPSGDSTSLSTHQSTGNAAFTWLASSSAAGIGVVPRMYSDGPPIVLGPGTTRSTEVDILSSAPAPAASSILFAFGSSHGILTVDKNFDLSWLTPKREVDSSFPPFPDRYITDVFAIEFLSDNHSILLSGGRNGLLDISDLRVPNCGTRADVIYHPSSITHIKQLDAHRIIVAGLNSSLCQYDLRFRKDTVQRSPSTEQRLHQKSRRNIKATRSILQYPDFWNNARRGLGFDVDFETGIVAAAQEQDEFHPSIQLFSLHGGSKLHSPAVSKTSPPFEDPQYVKCLQFAGPIDQGIKSLWIGEGRDIRRFSWADEANVTVDLY